MAAGGFGLTSIYQAAVFRGLDDRLGGTIRSLLETLDQGENGELSVIPPSDDARYDQTYSGRYWQAFRVNPGGGLDVVDGSRSLWDNQIEVDPADLARAVERPGQRITGAAVGPESQRLHLLMSAVRIGQSEDLVLLVAAIDRASADRDVRAFAFAASWMLALFALVLIAGVFVQVRLGLGPVFEMRKAVADIRQGERNRLDETAPAELAPLAHELNALVDHNREVVERARAQVGNLAHALKTPISVILNEARASEGPLAEVVQRQAERMQEQVEHQLKRASAASRAHSVGARSSVAAVVDDLSRTLPKMYSHRQIALELDVEPEVQFRGERQDLEEMVGNLLENAFKWARSRIRVDAGPSEGDDAMIRICVSDDGPGLPEEVRTEVLARGARFDEATPGSGLGLSIVRDLAQAYSGRLALGESAFGGLEAVIELPRSGGPA
ncbi:MAG: ATP-binding protein [Maricaulaceae bacterium]